MQGLTDSYKLVYISYPARGDSNSGEHSPADSKGADIHPGPALRKAHSLEHIDIEGRRPFEEVGYVMGYRWDVLVSVPFLKGLSR